MSDATIMALEASANLRMRAHEVHASNIANANVPDFKARRIDFDARMREALDGMENGTERTMIAREAQAAERLAQVEPDIYEDPLARQSGDGNTVNMEREQTELAKNTIAYEAALQLIAKKFAMNKLALEGGR